MALFTSAGITPRIVVRAFHRQTMLALFQSGAGVKLVSGSFVRMKIDGLCSRPLQTDDPSLCVGAAFREGHLPGVVAQFFVLRVRSLRRNLASQSCVCCAQPWLGVVVVQRNHVVRTRWMRGEKMTAR